MSQFNTGLPSVRQIQNFIKNKTYVEIGLITNQVLDGKIVWQDSQCISIVDKNEEKTLIWIQAIAYITPASEEKQSTIKASQH